MGFYQYEIIPSPANLEFTRVFDLAPGQPSDPLSGTLTTMSVLDPGPFEALSYVWGRNKAREAITCDGHELTITASLAVALRRLRYTTRPRTVWVDQVCINQDDLGERSQQVRHMNSIYQKAAKVLVWLGDDPEGHADRAFSLIKSLAALSQDPLRLDQFRSEQAGGGLDWFPDSHWLSLSQLFKQPWFDRKWILQEIGTDAPSELLWGDSQLDWTYLSQAAALLKDDGYALRRQYDLLVWKPWYMDKLFSQSAYESKTRNFTYELHRARWQLSSDPRDHIFALLGHPAAQEGPDGRQVLEADYTKPVEEVYLDFVVRMLEKGDSLMILNTVQHGSPKLGTGRDLPTWVTQWDSQDSLHNLLGDDTCVYRPSRGLKPNVYFLDSHRALTIEGAVVDTLGHVSDAFNTSDVTLESPTIAEVWAALDESGASGHLTTESEYVAGRPALFAFLETMSAVKKRKAQLPIPESQRLADGADFLAKAFGETHIVSADVREMGRGGDCYKWMERASGGVKCRKFARGVGGYYALCPPAAVAGDLLCLLIGGQTLFCLRPAGDDFLFVGECYVHGVMDGEGLDMMEDGRLSRTTFTIR